MNFVFLAEEIETYLLIPALSIYALIVYLTQLKYVPLMKIEEVRKLTTKQKLFRDEKVKQIKKVAYFRMVLAGLLHPAAYYLIQTYAMQGQVRSGYFVTIGLAFAVFIGITAFNFALKGFSLVKDDPTEMHRGF